MITQTTHVASQLPVRERKPNVHQLPLYGKASVWGSLFQQTLYSNSWRGYGMKMMGKKQANEKTARHNIQLKHLTVGRYSRKFDWSVLSCVWVTECLSIQLLMLLS